jgi:hypothetical protein
MKEDNYLNGGKGFWRMNNLVILILNDLIIFFLIYLISYFKEKGKNLATKEDIQKITEEVEKVKSFYKEERIKLEKELDSKIEVMKAKLKTTEIYFKKQLEALEMFLKIYKKIYPQYDMPQKDIENACLEVTNNLLKIQRELEIFLNKYEAYLSNESIKKIEKIIHHAVDMSILTDEDDEEISYNIGEKTLSLLQETKESIVREIKKNILF